MKKTLWIAIAGIIGVSSWYGVNQLSAKNMTDDYSYVTKGISMGEIRNTVSATGTLSAVDDVIIGTQLSGQISEIFVDFNDIVTANQLLAQIDPRSFKARVDQASAQVTKTQADIEIQKITISRAKIAYQQAQRDCQRGTELFENKFLSSTEFEKLKTEVEFAKLDYQHQQAQLKAQQANLVANQASLTQAKIDLAHTEIRSPIDGFVINRTIEQGQTVAASLNTPELFTVAKDLSLMEIEAHIDESDIGPVREGQLVDFTVDAFPNKKFKGEVKQIRHAPQSNSGVISYQVIISANNPNSLFLPGMTSNLEINIDSVSNAQRIDNSALRVAKKLSQSSELKGMKQLASLDLTEEQRLAIKKKMPKRERNSERMSGMGGKPQDGNQQKMLAILSEVLTPSQLEQYKNIASGKIKIGQLMVLANNQPQSINVQYGISDNQFTQVLNPDLSGKAIITAVKENK